MVYDEMQLSIFDIHDDVVFFVINYITPLDLFSLSQTCSHFYHLSDPTKYSAMNKCWKRKCNESWSLINKNKYTTDNYINLFRSMVEVIVWAIADDLDHYIRQILK